MKKTQIEKQQDLEIAAMKTRQEEILLDQSGLPRTRWKAHPSDDSLKNHVFTWWWDNVRDRYLAGDNFRITGGSREFRMSMASSMAVRVRDFDSGVQNPYPRSAVGYKHETPAIHATSKEQLYFPFTFEFRDVERLLEIKSVRDNASKYNDEEVHEYTFEEYVCLPDFYFLTEIGHEWPTPWKVKVVEDFLYARSDAGLPTIVTTAVTPIRKVREKNQENGAKIYERIADVITEWKGVGA